MNGLYFSDCCWAYVKEGEWIIDSSGILCGKCTNCGNWTKKLLTQEMINQKIKKDLGTQLYKEE